MWRGRIVTGLAIVCVLAALTGAIIARRADSGLVLRTVRIGKTPGSVTIAEQTGRAFVVDSGGWLRQTDPWSKVPAWLRRHLPFIPRPPASATVVPGSVTMLDATR